MVERERERVEREGKERERERGGKEIERERGGKREKDREETNPLYVAHKIMFLQNFDILNNFAKT